MITSQYFNITSDASIFASNRHISNKQHCAVWVKSLTNVWTQIPYNDYDLVNNSIILNDTLLNTIYSQVELRVADSQEELGTPVTDISTTASIKDEVVVVADNISDITTVADNIVNLNSIADNIVKAGVVADNITDVNLLADNMTGINIVASNKTNIDIAASNITEIQNASENASIATTKALEASISATSAYDSSIIASNSEIKASKWADNNYNVEVETGKYSAKHWAIVSQNSIGVKVVENISSLKTFNINEANQIEVLGYYAKGDEGGGLFYWDSVSTETDNGGTIIQATGMTTGRWKRVYSDSVNVKWFGAKGDGITDDTDSFLAAANTKKPITIPNTGSEYVLNLTYAKQMYIYAEINGVNTPVIRMNMLEDSVRGFWLRSNGSIKNLKIVQNALESGHSSGSLGVVIFAGEHRAGNFPRNDSNTETSNISIEGIEVDAVSMTRNNVITFQGNVKNFSIKNITIKGNFTIPVLCHWSFYKPDGVIDKSSHPRHGEITNIQSFPSSTGGYCAPYFSGCHDLTISNIYGEFGTRGMLIVAGDQGGLVANDDSVGRVLTGIKVDNVVLKNVVNEAIWVSGLGSLIYPLGMFYGVSYPTSVTINNVTVILGPASTACVPVRVSWMRGVDATNIQVQHEPGAVLTKTARTVVIENCVDIGFSVTGVTSQGILLSNVKKCNAEINLTGISAIQKTSSNYYGIDISGGQASAVIANAVAAGGTEIILDVVPTNIVPFTKFHFSGGEGVFLEGAYVNEENVTLKILPLQKELPASSSIAIESGCSDLNLTGTVSGFYFNSRTLGDSKISPSNINYSVNSFSSGRQSIFWMGGRNLTISNCMFSYSNSTNTTSTSAVRGRNIKRMRVTGCDFEYNNGLGSTVSPAVQLENSVEAGIVSENVIWSVASGASPIINNGVGSLNINNIIPT